MMRSEIFGVEINMYNNKISSQRSLSFADLLEQLAELDNKVTNRIFTKQEAKSFRNKSRILQNIMHEPDIYETNSSFSNQVATANLTMEISH